MENQDLVCNHDGKRVNFATGKYTVVKKTHLLLQKKKRTVRLKEIVVFKPTTLFLTDKSGKISDRRFTFLISHIYGINMKHRF